MSRYDPFEEMDRMFEQFRTRMWTPQSRMGTPERSFGDAGSREFGTLTRGDRGVRMDLTKHDEEYVFVADLPGFEREQIDLAFDDDTLTLTAESETSETTADDDGEIALRGEVRSSRRVSERVAIPEDVVEDEITASYRNGVLEVHLPLAEPAAEDEDDATKIDIDE